MRLVNWLKRQRQSKAQMISFYRDCFTSYAGKYVLADLCRHCNLETNTFNPENSHVTAFNEGKRAVVLHILNTLDLNSNTYLDQFHIGDNS